MSALLAPQRAASASSRGIAGLLGLAACAIGLVMAAHHPLAPRGAVLALAMWAAAVAWRPQLWLFALPAALPVADASPWSGGLAIDEFDLLVLGSIAGGYARLAASGIATARAGEPRPPTRWLPWALLPLVLTSAIALARGAADWPGSPFDWAAPEGHWLSSLRVGKSVLWAALLAPLVAQALQDAAVAAWRRLLAGWVTGLVLFVLVVLWERAAYPGLTDMAAPYRTVGLFWEMHLGGAAIDAYLALCAPLAAWALVSSTSWRRWWACALLALLFEHAWLTSFSRGAYLAVACGMTAFAALRPRPAGAAPAPPAWHRFSVRALVALMVLQAMLVGSGAFMATRTRLVAQDFGDRLTHWRDSLRLLDGASEWTWGIGLGRFPSRFAQAHAELVAGRRALDAPAGDTVVRLWGPPTNPALAGRYALTQRVAMDPATGTVVSLDTRADTPTTIDVSICEMHLLYEGSCQRAGVRVGLHAQRQRVELHPEDAPSMARHPWPPREAVFAIAVQGVGTSVWLDNISVRNARGAELLHNGDFSRGFPRWFPAAREYFLPWHVDGLWLELLVEQGLLGVIAFAVLMVSVFRRLLAPRNRGLATTPLLVGSLVGAMCVGLVSSVFDMPRVAFLLLLLAVVALASHPSDDAAG